MALDHSLIQDKWQAWCRLMRL
ncbi:4-hydroxybenzoate polyprenyltransferase, partial [Sodalis-like endosymbiont of Proechinophthirus fluctus]